MPNTFRYPCSTTKLFCLLHTLYFTEKSIYTALDCFYCKVIWFDVVQTFVVTITTFQMFKKNTVTVMNIHWCDWLNNESSSFFSSKGRTESILSSQLLTISDTWCSESIFFLNVFYNVCTSIRGSKSPQNVKRKILEISCDSSNLINNFRHSNSPMKRINSLR